MWYLKTYFMIFGNSSIFIQYKYDVPELAIDVVHIYTKSNPVSNAVHIMLSVNLFIYQMN